MAARVPLDVVHDALRPLDVADYHRMLEAGILARDERVEVVEVADSSARIDRGPKAAIYAAAAIPEYWIVDVARGRVEVLTEPDAAAAEYRTRRTLDRDDVLRTATLATLALRVDDLFAP